MLWESGCRAPGTPWCCAQSGNPFAWMNNVSVAHVIWWNLVVAGALTEMVALGCVLRADCNKKRG